MQKSTELFYEQVELSKKELYFNGRHIEVDTSEFQNVCTKLTTIQRQRLPMYSQSDLTIASYKKHLVLTGKFVQTEQDATREAFIGIVYDTIDATRAYNEISKKASEINKTVPSVNFQEVDKALRKMKRNLRIKALFAALIIILLVLYFIIPKI